MLPSSSPGPPSMRQHQHSLELDSYSLLSFLSASNVPSVVLHLGDAAPARFELPDHIADCVAFRNKTLQDFHLRALNDSNLFSISEKPSVSTVTTSRGDVWNAVFTSHHVILTFQESTNIIPPDGEETQALYWISESELDAKQVPLNYITSQAEHVDLVRNRIDWAATPLGTQRTWDPVLRSYVSMVLASPFPSLIGWGEKLVMIYNQPYANVIGQKHPWIMGLPYAEAWVEIWDQIKGSLAAAMKGDGTHSDHTLMFLQRSDHLEECYFTFSMIPIRGETGEIVGVYVPNFDGSQSVIRERQMSTLQNLGQSLSGVTEFPEFYARAEESLGENMIDMPLVIIYSTDAYAELQSSDSLGKSSIEYESERSFSRMVDENPDILSFTKEVQIGIEGTHPVFPEQFVSNVDEPPSDSELGIKSYIHQIRQGADVIKLPLEFVKKAMGDLKCVTWNEEITHVLMVPIRPLDRDRLYAVAIVGLNTRRPYNTDSTLFIRLLQRQLTAGIAGVMLFTEEVRRTKSLAALNSRKNEELRILLDARTKELRETEGKFQRMAEVARSGLLIANPEGHITFANQSWYDISGHPRDQDPNEFLESIHPEDVEAVRESWRQAITLPIQLEFRWKRLTDRGLVRWCQSLTTVERDAVGKQIIAITVSSMDISERVRMEELLRKEASEATERKRQQEYFIDMTSHEMRNPLSAIMHSLELISSSMASLQQDILTARNDRTRQLEFDRSLADVEEAMETVKIVGLCSSHMKRLIDDTLTLSKLESDLVVLNPLPFDPREFCRLLLKMFEAEIQAKDIKMVLDVRQGFSENGGALLDADSARLSQILINLITNAIKFTNNRPTRKITLSIECRTERPVLPKFDFRMLESDVTTMDSLKDYNQSTGTPPCAIENGLEHVDALDKDTRFLVVKVTDSGVGMSKAELGLLFHRFSQIKPRTHTTYDGSGLGLYISKMLTARLGGEITVESVEGQGSTFTFYIETKTLASAYITPANTLSVPRQLQDQRSDSEPVETSSKLAVPPIHIAVSRLALNRENTPSSPPMTPSLATRLHVGAQPNEPLYRLLLVEDNIINQKLMCKQLLRAGCQVATADNGLAALEYLLTTTLNPLSSPASPIIDLVLMDVEMPIMDGLTACRKIREMEKEGRLRRHVPIIAVTANARQEQIRGILGVGMDSAISKPFKWPVLMAEIARVLEVVNGTEAGEEAGDG